MRPSPTPTTDAATAGGGDAAAGVARATDLGVAAVLFAWFGWSASRAAFESMEWADWIAYALPAANLVERGTLATPQLGAFAGFDRAWLFNAPLMGLGPAPFYAASHVGRVPYLAGMAVAAVLNLAVFSLAVRRTVAPGSWAASVLGSQAILSHRAYLSVLYLQRYDAFAYGAMAAAFLPTLDRTGRIPAWRWLCAGLLTLVHPALGPAVLLWLATAAGFSAASGTRPGWLGPTLFGAAALCAAGWYLRPGPLRDQFLPYLWSMSRRMGQSRDLTVFRLDASAAAGLASRATSLAILLSASWVVIAPGLPRWRDGAGLLVRAPALGIAGMTAVDVARRFPYLNYYVLGLAPALLFACTTGRRRRFALAGVLALAAANVAVSLRVDRKSSFTAPPQVDQAEAVAEVVRRTRPGDRIVLGPPFVLASAPRALPGGRVVVGVVPQVWYLEGFDGAAYREALRGAGDVYVGEPTWYRFAYYFDRERSAAGAATPGPGVPLFESAEVEAAHWPGGDVVIARRRPGPEDRAEP